MGSRKRQVMSPTAHLPILPAYLYTPVNVATLSCLLLFMEALLAIYLTMSQLKIGN